MIDKKEIQDFVDKKKVLLIGNAPHDESTLSSYDVIVRMNLGIINNTADIWVNNLIERNYKDWNLQPQNFKYIMKLNAQGGTNSMKNGLPTGLFHKTYFWNKREHDSIFNRFLTYTRPFTGTGAVLWFLEYTTPKQLDVIGMEFYKGLKHSPVHNPELDRACIACMDEELEHFNWIR